MKNVIFPSFIALLAAACGNERPNVTQHSIDRTCGDDGIVVSDAWIRAARPGQPTSAAYLTLCNGGESDDALIGFTFSGAQAAELHTTNVSDDATISMAPTDEIAVGAGQMAKLEPEGQHVMLIGLDEPLLDGETSIATLTFRNAPEITLEFEIRDAASDHQNHH